MTICIWKAGNFVALAQAPTIEAWARVLVHVTEIAADLYFFDCVISQKQTSSAIAMML